MGNILNLNFGMLNSVECFRGRLLTIDLVYGNCWYRMVDGRRVEVDYRHYLDRKLDFVALDFIKIDGAIRGVRGAVKDWDGGEFGPNIFCFGIADGKDFNLNDVVCPFWMIYFGRDEVRSKHLAEINCDDDMILGWGMHVRIKVSDNSGAC